MASSGAQQFVDFEVGETKYRFRKPTVGQRARVYEKAGLDSADQKNLKVNIAKLQVAALIETLVDESGGAVFVDTDFESLMASRAGSDIDKLASKAASLLNEGEAGKS